MSEKKLSKFHARRLNESDFTFQCEWGDCDEKFETMSLMNNHVYQHRIDYLRILCKGKTSLEGEFEFVCQWKDCAAQIVGATDEFARHLYYHNFHQYLKQLGKHIQKVDNLPECILEVDSRNIIPELPERLICQWSECGQEFDNPYVFYGHVGFHGDDFPKGKMKPESITCKWRGCTHTVKTAHKIKEHMRSHTQAKQVACPTCGSLFANNTKFVDHLLRQKADSRDQRFVCSHCNKQFGSDRILRDHMRHHVNFYKCQLCDMTCPSPSHLRDHVRYRHANVRMFQCDLCDHKSKSAEDLRKHRVIHGIDSDETITCKQEDCGKVFRSFLHLMRHHKEVHEQQNGLYACHLCERKFTRGHSLTTHLHGDHNYKWPSGHKRFRYKLKEDGLYRLQTIRYESMEVSQQVLGAKLGSPHPSNLETAVNTCSESEGESTDCERLQITCENNEIQTELIITRKSPLKYFKRKNMNDHEDESNDRKSKNSRKISKTIQENQQDQNFERPKQKIDKSCTSSFLSHAANVGFSKAESSVGLSDGNSASSTKNSLSARISLPATSLQSPSDHGSSSYSGAWTEAKMRCPRASTPTSISSQNDSNFLPLSPSPSVREENLVNSPSRLTWQSSMGKISFSPEKLGFSVTDATTPINWELSPLKQDNPKFGGEVIPVELPHPLDVGPQSFPIDLSPHKKRTLQHRYEEEEEDDSDNEITNNNKNTDLYNLEMLGAVALRTRQSARRKI